jgi:hypothetical protein
MLDLLFSKKSAAIRMWLMAERPAPAETSASLKFDIPNTKRCVIDTSSDYVVQQ